MKVNFKVWIESEKDYIFDIVQEGTITPEDIEDIRSELDSKGYASVIMTHSGEIFGPNIGTDWHLNKASWRDKKNSINIILSKQKDGNIIKLRTYGHLLTPSGLDALKTLKDSGIIDDTWKIDPNFVQPKEYIDDKYTSFQGGLHGQNPTVGSMINRPVFSKDISSNDLVLWHGTSSKDWEQIQRDGKLVPLFHGNNQQYGYQSRVKHKYNADHLYLATNEDIAWEFAKDRSRDQNRLSDKESWKYIQHDGPSKWPIKPVLLKVKVPNIANLRSDDDPINDILRNVADRIWDKKTDEEKEQIAQYLRKKTGMDLKDPSVTKMIWREDDDTGWPEIEKRIPSRAYKAWIASIKRKGHVAYKGAIPIEYIQEVPFIPR